MTGNDVDARTTHDLAHDLIERRVHLVEVLGTGRREAWAFRSREQAERTALGAAQEAVAELEVDVADLPPLSSWSDMHTAYCALRTGRYPCLPAIEIRAIPLDKERPYGGSVSSSRPLGSILRLRDPENDGT